MPLDPIPPFRSVEMISRKGVRRLRMLPRGCIDYAGCDQRFHQCKHAASECCLKLATFKVRELLFFDLGSTFSLASQTPLAKAAPFSFLEATSLPLSFFSLRLWCPLFASSIIRPTLFSFRALLRCSFDSYVFLLIDNCLVFPNNRSIYAPSRNSSNLENQPMSAFATFCFIDKNQIP